MIYHTKRKSQIRFLILNIILFIRRYVKLVLKLKRFIKDAVNWWNVFQHKRSNTSQSIKLNNNSQKLI